MTTKQEIIYGGREHRLRTVRLATALACLLAGASAVATADQRLDVLTTGKSVYKNVTVTEKSPDHVFIRYEGGVANIKVADLEDDARQALGYAPVKPPRWSVNRESGSSNQGISAIMSLASVERIQSLAGSKLPPNLTGIQVTPPMVIGLLTGAVLAYLFLCHCFGLICRKSGHEPGVLIWIPALQLIPLLRAAGMSGWWILAYLLPVVNLLAHVLWSANIVQARGKSVWWTIPMILPLTNLLALFYLAFSDARSADREPRVRVITPQTA